MYSIIRQKMELKIHHRMAMMSSKLERNGENIEFEINHYMRNQMAYNKSVFPVIYPEC